MPMLLYGNGTISGATSFTDNIQFNGTVGVTGAVSTSSNLTVSGRANVTQGLTTAARGINNASVPSGSILQVQQAVITGTFSTTSTSFTDITGVSVSITPSSSTSKILIMASMYRGCTSAVQTRFRLMRSGSPLYISDAAGSRSQSSAGCYVGNADVGYHFASVMINYVDSPATTSAITYNVQLACQGGETIYIGRTGTDGDGSTTMRAPASIILMEIAQ